MPWPMRSRRSMRRTAIRSSTLMAMEGMRALRDALPGIVAMPRDLEARAEALYGAWLLRHGARHGRHGAAPQDLPHARRHVRHAACRNPCDHAAAHRPPTTPPRCPNCCAGRRNASAARSGRRRSGISPQSIGAPLRSEGPRPQARPISIARRRSRRKIPTANPRPIDRGSIRALLQDCLGGPAAGAES